MLHIIRTLIVPLISKNLLILNIISILRYYAGYPRYLFSLKFNYEYIGGYLLSDQESGRNRQKIIKKIVFKINKNFVKVLEIGVYCGQTTLNLSKELKKHNKDFQITCLDIWDDYENTTSHEREGEEEEKGEGAYRFSFPHKKLVEVLKNKLVYNLFIHNLKVNNVLDKCKIIKKKSNDFLQTTNEKYDLIIVDGSHLFKEVSQDLENAKKIINNQGFIIGDDYEVKYSKLKNINLKELCKKKDKYLGNFFIFDT